MKEKGEKDYFQCVLILAAYDSSVCILAVDTWR